MSETNKCYKSVWFTVPSRIMDLPDLSLAYLKVYETIFQFWNHGKACFLSNQMIMNRTGITASSTVKLALAYFEKHGELKRVTENGKRYLVQPEQRLEMSEELEAVDNSEGVADASARGSRCVGQGVADASAYNINNININNLKREKKRKKRPPSSEILYFKPNQESIDFAKVHDIDLTKELKSFQERHTRKKTQYEFMRWLEKALEFKETNKRPASTYNHSLYKDFDKNKHQYDVPRTPMPRELKEIVSKLKISSPIPLQNGSY